MGSLLDAAFRVVHRAPGGAAALEVRLGKSAGSLSHEVRGRPGTKLGLETAEAVTHMTGDLEILMRFAESCGQMLVPLPELAGAHHDDVMAALSEAGGDYADLVRETCADMGDGALSQNEFDRIEARRMALIAHLHRFGDVTRARYLASQSGPLRGAA